MGATPLTRRLTPLPLQFSVPLETAKARRAAPMHPVDINAKVSQGSQQALKQTEATLQAETPPLAMGRVAGVDHELGNRISAASGEAVECKAHGEVEVTSKLILQQKELAQTMEKLSGNLVINNKTGAKKPVREIVHSIGSHEIPTSPANNSPSLSKLQTAAQFLSNGIPKTHYAMDSMMSEKDLYILTNQIKQFSNELSQASAEIEKEINENTGLSESEKAELTSKKEQMDSCKTSLNELKNHFETTVRKRRTMKGAIATVDIGYHALKVPGAAINVIPAVESISGPAAGAMGGVLPGVGIVTGTIQAGVGVYNIGEGTLRKHKIDQISKGRSEKAQTMAPQAEVKGSSSPTDSAKPSSVPQKQVDEKLDKLFDEHVKHLKMHNNAKIAVGSTYLLGGLTSVAISVVNLVLWATAPLTAGASLGVSIGLSAGSAASSVGGIAARQGIYYKHESAKEKMAKETPEKSEEGVALRLLELVDKEGRTEEETQLLLDVCATDKGMSKTLAKAEKKAEKQGIPTDNDFKVKVIRSCLKNKLISSYVKNPKRYEKIYNGVYHPNKEAEETAAHNNLHKYEEETEFDGSTLQPDTAAPAA